MNTVQVRVKDRVDRTESSDAAPLRKYDATQSNLYKAMGKEATSGDFEIDISFVDHIVTTWDGTKMSRYGTRVTTTPDSNPHVT